MGREEKWNNEKEGREIKTTVMKTSKRTTKGRKQRQLKTKTVNEAQKARWQYNKRIPLASKTKIKNESPLTITGKPKASKKSASNKKNVRI